MEIYLSLLLAIIGLVVYLLATTNPKVAKLAELTFAVSLLAFLICLCNGSHTFGIIPK